MLNWVEGLWWIVLWMGQSAQIWILSPLSGYKKIYKNWNKLNDVQAWLCHQTYLTTGKYFQHNSPDKITIVELNLQTELVS
jgi:hypothetical protein